MHTRYAFIIASLLFAFAQAESAQSSDFESALSGNISEVQVVMPPAAPEQVQTEAAPSFGRLVTYDFYAESFPGFYDARGQNKEPYNIPEILRDVPELWKAQGALFKKVGMAMEMDPYALASYCVFESYNEIDHEFNVNHLDGVAAGIASTQASDVLGGRVPGLSVRIPKQLSNAKTMLLNNPEYGLRFLAAEFKAWYYGGDFFRNYYGDEMFNRLFETEYFQGYHDLAKSFPRVAVPGWTKPNKARRNYGTQAQYVSRAYVLYNAFRAADKN
ncbi:MAG: hypothetical protein NTX59_05270 [Elusimicrobia bacterium]|nr:hypothetical protein [Elusimicrobiota bacterium]